MPMADVGDTAFRVTALSWSVPADGRLSWVPPGRIGHDPQNLHLVEGEDRLLVIDTGLAVHLDAILAELGDRRAGRRIVIYLTRIEPECMLNLPALLDRLPDVEVATAVPLSPFDLVHLPHPDLARRVKVSHLAFGGTLEAVGFPLMRILRPPINTLSTSWLSDARSGALFTSDFFALDLAGHEGTPAIRCTAEDLPPRDVLRAGILHKFDWLPRARQEPIAAAWDATFRDLAPIALCPTHGRIAVGADVVARIVSDYRAAIFGASPN